LEERHISLYTNMVITNVEGVLGQLLFGNGYIVHHLEQILRRERLVGGTPTSLFKVCHSFKMMNDCPFPLFSL
jgi:hypothetical protein